MNAHQRRIARRKPKPYFDLEASANGLHVMWPSQRHALQFRPYQAKAMQDVIDRSINIVGLGTPTLKPWYFQI